MASKVRTGRGVALRLLPRIAAIGLAAALVTLLPGIARAQTSFVLLPRLGVGVTNNPTGLSGQQRTDGVGMAAVSGQLAYDGALTTQSLSYRVAYTKFLRSTLADTLTNQLSWASTYRLSGAWALGAGAEAMITRTSQIPTTADLTPAMLPQAAIGGANLYFAANATQTLTYSPKADQTYHEALRVQYLNYLEGLALPTTLATVGSLGADWLRGLNTFSAELDITGSATSSPGLGALDGRLFMVGALAGWRRELSALWVGSARAGGAILVTGGKTSVEPLGILSVEFHRAPWFATLSASHQITPNMFTGDITRNDQVVAHVAVPLDRRELIALSGGASYAHASLVSSTQALPTGSFDQWSTVAALTGHLPRWPFWAALEYTLMHQVNHSTTATAVPDLQRQTLMLSVGGAFTWGATAPGAAGPGM